MDLSHDQGPSQMVGKGAMRVDTGATKGMRQVVRQLELLRSLQASHYGRSVTQLAEEFDVNKRTVQRDLTDLRDAGFILRSEQREDQHVYWHLDKDPKFPLNIPVMEIAAILFAEKAGFGLAGTPFGEHLHSAVRRFTNRMPLEMREFLDRAAAAYVPLLRGQKSYEESRDLVEELNDALLQQKVCRVTYRTPHRDEALTYEIEPLRLLHYRGGLYLISRVPRHDNLITQAVERIEALEVSHETFEPPPEQSVDARLTESFGITHEEPMDVVVRFSAEQAPYVRERIWHPSQEIEELEDGRVVLRFRAGGFYEIKSWVLSFGAAAEVLGPASLKMAVTEELRRALTTLEREAT